jgi:hypothetical protein
MRMNEQQKIEALRAALVTKNSALENYGRHFDWCFVSKVTNANGKLGIITNEAEACDCGLMRERASHLKVLADAEASKRFVSPKYYDKNI